MLTEERCGLLQGGCAVDGERAGPGRERGGTIRGSKGDQKRKGLILVRAKREAGVERGEGARASGRDATEDYLMRDRGV